MKYFITVIMICAYTFAWGQDKVVLSGGYGSADVGANEHEVYSFRLAGKNQTTLIALDYDYLTYSKKTIETASSKEKVTDSQVQEVSFMLGQCISFGSYSSFNLSGGLSIIHLKEEYRESSPLLPEKKRKDMGFPLSSSVSLGLMKYLGVTFKAKKSFNDIASYFSYSLYMDLIF